MAGVIFHGVFKCPTTDLSRVHLGSCHYVAKLDDLESLEKREN